MAGKSKAKNGAGYRFEVWAEHLFRQIGYHSVKRNVIYRVKGFLTGKERTRQVDVQYTRLLDMEKLNLASLVIVECKYRPACVDDVVKLHGTKKIVGADRAELMLAKRPSYAVMDAAERYKVKVYSPDELRKYHVFSGKTLAQQVSSVRLNEYDNSATVINLRSMF